MRALLFALFALTLAPAAHASPLRASGGTSKNLSKSRALYASKTLGGLPANKVRGVGVCAGPGNTVSYALYRDGRISRGNSRDLAAHQSRVTQVTFPQGYDANDVVGMACKGRWRERSRRVSYRLYVYFNDGKYGSMSHQSFTITGLKAYRLAAGYKPTQIRGVGRDDLTGLTCAWFRNNMVSCGSESNLASKRPPYRFKAPLRTSQLMGVGVDGKTKLNTAWYR